MVACRLAIELVILLLGTEFLSGSLEGVDICMAGAVVFWIGCSD